MSDAALAMASLVTCSYSGDLDVCRLLCESVDRFVAPEIGHKLYVPAKDVPLFAEFASPRRTIATQESLLPRWFWKVPLPSPAWRARLGLPRRNVYLTPFSAPVRGWIAQQIMKLAATAQDDAEIVVHVDSDNAFIRPLRLDHLTRDGRVRLYRNPQMVEMESHRAWHAAAGRLLGLPHADFYGAEYIDQLVVWRRSVLLALIARLAEVAGRDWRVALARTPHFAEYILYGVFADRVRGLEAAGLFASDQSLCLSRWSGAFDGAADEDAFIAALRPDHVACLIQSTIAMPLAERRRIFERATASAAAQEAA
jgi:hypothetical protein